jgi:CRP/FNR family transcriptional regulator
MTPIHQIAPGLRAACSQCSLHELCLPVGLDTADMEEVDRLVSTRRKVHRGASLFHAGDPFSALYAVRYGFFKSFITTTDGRDQVTGFYMTGEILGMDGIGSERHTCTLMALEDSEVCVMPFARVEEMSRAVEPLQRHFHKIMSREIVRDHGVMLLLGSMRAEQRMAAFLLNLAQRLQARGFSPTSLVLRMTREEIGTYLGLKLETVSRCFSKLHDDGVLQVRARQIRILDPGALRRLVG